MLELVVPTEFVRAKDPWFKASNIFTMKMRTSMPRELQIVHALRVLMLKKTQVAFAQSVRRASRASWSWRDAQIALHCCHRFCFIRVIICLSPQPQQCVGDAGEDGGGRVSFHQYRWIEGNSSKEMQGGWLWFTLLVWAWWVVCVFVICLQNNCRVWSCLRQPSDKRLIAK